MTVAASVKPHHQAVMQRILDHFDHPFDAAEFKRPAHRPGVECYRAHLVRHVFDPHAHDAFGLGAIETGVERFRYRGSDHLAPPGTLVLMNPDELHTGRAETNGGWRYRMLYLDADLLKQITGESGWWFTKPTDHDAPRARRVSHLLREMWHAPDSLAFDGLLLNVIDEFRPCARVALPERNAPLVRFAPVIEHLHARLAEHVTLQELAAVVGLSPFHFLRQFKRALHATPQQMLMALRLLAAKQRLAAGEAPAQVATAVGLTDQAHLTRAFGSRYGITPARYQQQLGTRPRRTA